MRGGFIGRLLSSLFSFLGFPLIPFCTPRCGVIGMSDEPFFKVRKAFCTSFRTFNARRSSSVMVRKCTVTRRLATARFAALTSQ
jgi:hypothetical protein